MLAVGLLFMVTGFTLVYAGLHKGDGWQRPWGPFVDALSGPDAVAPLEPAA